ncbi:hypothetical protein NQ318_021622 [Aromia moschata]|uniref:C2H2-type domain-containing protein n=1 Tax=Aromia moschata TaxID=1265417 RepID=A0AAV8XA55_9CUCU|nr:hypothetical protein NQ318_021622 [Aromia moschata]
MTAVFVPTTKRKNHLKSHMLIHKDALKIKTYDWCRFYSYKAKRKGHLKLHMLIHMDASEITTYDCNFCSYKAKRKDYLTTQTGFIKMLLGNDLHLQTLFISDKTQKSSKDSRCVSEVVAP